MDDHTPAPKDTSIRDGLIGLSVILFLYISSNIITITPEKVLTGEVPRAVLSFFGISITLEPILDFLVSIKSGLTVLLLILFALIIWVRLRAAEVHHHEHEKYKAIETEETVASEKMIQWQVVLDHVNSESPAEWKLAILEADNILDEVLEGEGYVGESVAEKLKAMSRTRISSYDDVWDAHKLRNEIAHGGAIDMDLTKKMARDAVAKFEGAFRELGYL